MATPRFARIDEGPLNNFDFLRFVLALFVIFRHSLNDSRESERLDPFAYFSHGQTNAGTFAVGAFLLVSGFLVAHSWSRSTEAVDFLRRRVLRIYPGFL